MLKTWENLCSKFSPEQLINILRRTVPNYRPVHDYTLFKKMYLIRLIKSVSLNFQTLDYNCRRYIC